MISDKSNTLTQVVIVVVVVETGVDVYSSKCTLLTHTNRFSTISYFTNSFTAAEFENLSGVYKIRHFACERAFEI